MRYFYLVFCGISSWLAGSAQAQELPAGPAPAADTVWYDATADKRCVSSQTDSTGTCAEVLRWGEAAGLVRVYYPSGHLKEYMPYADLATGRRHGLTTTWYDSGRLHTRQPYANGQRTGTLVVYYETGALKRQTDFVAGNEQIGTCFGPDGQPVAYFPYEQLPLYPGGPAQLTKEIIRALRLPYQLQANSYPEPLQVEVMLPIAEDGSIEPPQVARSSGLALFDQAVLAAIAKLPRHFSPGRRDGHLVACAYYLPVQLGMLPPIRRGSR